jgi:hypothetical protein
LRDLHWLRMQRRKQVEVAVLTFRCHHGLALPYLSECLQRVTDLPSRRRLNVINSGSRRTIYTSIYSRRQSVPGRRRQNLEQSAGFRNNGSFVADVSLTPKDGTIS